MLSTFILDTLFPIRCVSCQKEGSWICTLCAAQIPIQSEHVCGVCEKMITPDGRTCHDCKKKSALDGLISSSLYGQSCIANAVHLFKYRFIIDLHVELGELLVKTLQKTDIPLPDLIMPVPLHPRRLRWRGFNQSALLAADVANKLLPLTEISLSTNSLVRHRYTCPQMEIKNYLSRQQNLAGAFSVTKKDDVQNKTILLIDDVATTGTTIFECARVLKAAGAKEIYAAVIARQEIKSRI